MELFEAPEVEAIMEEPKAKKAKKSKKADKAESDADEKSECDDDMSNDETNAVESA